MLSENTMSRHKSREQAFIILFEKCFNDCSIDEIIENAQLAREVVLSDFARQIVNGVCDNLELIDKTIEENLKGWSKTRISKTSLCLLRIAIFEILFSKDVPVSVGVNEAVELAKIYSTVKDAQFINGLLGSVAKARDNRNE